MTLSQFSGGTSIAHTPLVFLDIESTGLAPATDRICEVALLRVRSKATEARYTALVNPQQPMGAQALSVHGITPDLLDGAPVFAEIAPTLLGLLAGATLVAHNAPFDMAFLSDELERLGLPAPTNPVLDTLV